MLHSQLDQRQLFKMVQRKTVNKTTFENEIEVSLFFILGTASILQPNTSSSPSPIPTTLRFVRPTTTNNTPTSKYEEIVLNEISYYDFSFSLMMMSSGQRLSTPILSKPQTGNIIVQVTNNDNLQSKLSDKSTAKLIKFNILF